MTKPRLSLLLAASALLALAPALAPAPALAQQGEWFVPGGQQRPQGQPPAQRPPGQGQQQGQQRPAQPNRPPPALVGIVDIPEIQRVSTAFNQVREEIERRRTRLNEDLQREQNAWRDAQQALAAQRATLTPDEIRARERELQDRITDAQRIFRNRSQSIEQTAQQALVQIEQTLAGIVRSTAQARGVNMVLPRQLVIMNDPAFDMTEQVAQQFNRTLREVTLPPDSDGSQPPQAQRQPPPAAPPPAPPRRN